MNFRRCLWVMLVFYLIILPVYASQLDNKLNDLSKQIISSMTKNKGLINNNNKVTIAVIEFSTIDGKNTLLGRSISEQLTTKLYLTNEFDIIERGLLEKVLAELKLNATGIIDSKSAYWRN
jgi:curli biogenesis system outer membrane secretion channel CsgG